MLRVSFAPVDASSQVLASERIGSVSDEYSGNVFSQAVEGVSIIRMTWNSLSFVNEHGSERLQDRSRLRQDTSMIFLRHIRSAAGNGSSGWGPLHCVGVEVGI